MYSDVLKINYKLIRNRQRGSKFSLDVVGRMYIVRTAYLQIFGSQQCFRSTRNPR